ncbi:MAG: hypothetical protein AVDCRST_MAG01-01-3696 [uncultured Rubrobacteraceae bacterium]|uniref:Uncharacterized protein n=1 Tax=uncultured Rubrobacteraceae bacterium TaxID=349277 RepID=A0A6J4QGT0_9ACTN|nr:MAG: hypothetical protein AVDCRST_MAG01-01-3696 [uncultured Rubrobacteraceae bacterium]
MHPVEARAAHDDVLGGLVGHREDPVVAPSAVDGVNRVLGRAVVAQAVADEVPAFAAREGVRAKAALQVVGAVVSGEGVGTRVPVVRARRPRKAVADENVLARPAAHGVVAGAAYEQAVSAAEALYGVVAALAVQVVGPVRTHHRIALGAAVLLQRHSHPRREGRHQGCHRQNRHRPPHVVPLLVSAPGRPGWHGRHYGGGGLQDCGKQVTVATCFGNGSATHRGEAHRSGLFSVLLTKGLLGSCSFAR